MQSDWGQQKLLRPEAAKQKIETMACSSSWAPPTGHERRCLKVTQKSACLLVFSCAGVLGAFCNTHQINGCAS